MGAKLGGGGGGRFDLGQNADINVTPFVDVMLVLLIIFMVSAPLATVSISIDLPPPQPNVTPPPREPIWINVSKNSRVFIGSQQTSIETLVKDWAAVIGGPNPKEERVMIRADRDVPYKEFMAVLNELQGEGYLKIALMSENY